MIIENAIKLMRKKKIIPERENKKMAMKM